MWQFDQGIKEILENSRSVFYFLTPEEKEEIQNHVYLSSYRRNEYIFKEGDKPSGFLMLVNGKVKIFKEGVGGREQIIRLSKPMGIIGYRALFAEEIHIASAVTLEDSVIANITFDFIVNRALKNNEFALKLINKLAVELGFSNYRTVTLTQKHIRGRLAESLILLADKYGFEHDGITLQVYMSREDIANLSNMTTSNAIRTLSTFANEKLIAIDGRKIKVLDIYKLDRISKLG
jgi:CRP/FNR family transcriptional regulator, polysaccharide utilization system transcription regulator